MEDQSSSMEYLWVYQPYLRADLLPRSHWPTQNRLCVFIHFCFVFVIFFSYWGFCLCWFSLLVFWGELGFFCCSCWGDSKRTQSLVATELERRMSKELGENMIKYSVWKFLIKKHLDAMTFLVFWAFAFNLPVSLCFRCIEQLIFSFYKTNDEFDYMHCNY